MLAVAAVVWAFFGGIVAASLGTLALYTLRLVRGVKDLSRSARRVTEELNAAVGDIRSGMQAVEEGLGRVGQGLQRTRERR
jgi:hypothetical protein